MLLGHRPFESPKSIHKSVLLASIYDHIKLGKYQLIISMLVGKDGSSELSFDLSAFEKKDQSEIEQLKQILEAAEIIKTVARQNRIMNVEEYETENNKQMIPKIPNKKIANIVGIINEYERDSQNFDTHTPNVIPQKEEQNEMNSSLDQKIMASEKHQRLVNTLALELETQHGIKITGIHIDGDPQLFDQKFRNLPIPNDHEGIPDLQGEDSNGTIHLGKAEIDVNDSNVEEKLKSFSSRYMIGTKTPTPLHVIVPKETKEDMESKIRQIGLGDKLDFGIISVWS